MSDSTRCPHCGKPLPDSGLGGLCPECMLKVGAANPTVGDPATDGPTEASRPVAPAEPSELARFFPQLEILECLGRGGMGVVYKARQPTLNRLVALKVLAPEKGSDPKFAGRFTREAQALARLNHPNIVTVHDFGEAGGRCYLVMEFVDGVSLRQLLARREIAPEAALAIVPRICEALQYAHEQGIVHRDIKPENVLLDRTGRVKIADFGIAKILGEVPTRMALTEERQVIGTPHYMAPEQVERPLQVDHRADIYSLGVVFYEMLTGELPLGRFAPPSRKVQIDVRLDEVVLHALEKEPERRYQQAGEVKTDVEQIAAEGSSKAAESSLGSAGASDLRPEISDSRSSTPDAGGHHFDGRRRKALWYGFLVSLLGVPAGLMMKAPAVWLLGLLGVALGASKLGLLQRWGDWSRAAGATEPPERKSAPGRTAGSGLALAVERQVHQVPRILWVPIVLLLLVGLARALGIPREPIAALAHVVLAIGLFFRSKAAFALALCFAGLGVVIVAMTGPPAVVAWVLLTHTLMAVPLLLCTDWYFPRDQVTGRRLRAEQVVIPLIMVPPVLFLMFLRGGYALLGMDLDADVLFVVGVVGLPFSVLLGLLLAAVGLRALPPSIASEEPDDRLGRRWSAWTIGALSLLALSLPLGGGLSVLFQLVSQERGWNPSGREALVTLALAGLGVMVIIGTAALGIEALRRMRTDPVCSKGRLGALISVWLWPCLLAGALLTPVRVSVAERRTDEVRRAAERAGIEAETARQEPRPTGPKSAENPAWIGITADGRGGFASIQAALDAAPAGAVIRIGPGRFDERLRILKPVSLEGAGWMETTIGPSTSWSTPGEAETRALQQELREARDPEAQQRVRERVARFMPAPVVQVRGANGVRFSGLKLASPGVPPEGRLLDAAVVDAAGAELALTGCAIVGSPGNGIQISDGARLVVSNTLVAAAWNTGIVVPRGGIPCRLTVTDSDLRNCHYAGIVIGRGGHQATIQRCRISGAAWHGIRYDDGTPAVANCLIFGNARSGIYASGKTSALVQGNVFWKNEMNGMSCWYENRDRIEHNIFALNLREGVAILGASEPVLERNVFWGQPQAIFVGAIMGEGANSAANGALHLAGNVFWTNAVNLFVPPEQGQPAGAPPAASSRTIADFPGNQEADPGYADAPGADFSRDARWAGDLGQVGAPAPLPLASPWPLQPEERAIIPDGVTRDSRGWKRPRAL